MGPRGINGCHRRRIDPFFIVIVVIVVFVVVFIVLMLVIHLLTMETFLLASFFTHNIK